MIPYCIIPTNSWPAIIPLTEKIMQLCRLGINFKKFSFTNWEWPTNTRIESFREHFSSSTSLLDVKAYYICASGKSTDWLNKTSKQEWEIGSAAVCQRTPKWVALYHEFVLRNYSVTLGWMSEKTTKKEEEEEEGENKNRFPLTIFFCAS